MTEYQLQAMSRTGETGEVIFRDSPNSGSDPAASLKEHLVERICYHCVDGSVWPPMARAWAGQAVDEAFAAATGVRA